MAEPSKNDYLADPAVRAKLRGHHPKLITVHWQGIDENEPGEPHFVFNTAVEEELLSPYLEGFSDIDYRDGVVTVEDATKATYGYIDVYVRNRLAKTHLKLDGSYNKHQANGHLTIVAADGNTIVRGGTDAIGANHLQTRLDSWATKVITTATKSSRYVNAAERRVKKLAPGVDIKAMKAETLSQVVEREQRAIEEG